MMKSIATFVLTFLVALTGSTGGTLAQAGPKSEPGPRGDEYPTVSTAPMADDDVVSDPQPTTLRQRLQMVKDHLARLQQAAINRGDEVIPGTGERLSVIRYQLATIRQRVDALDGRSWWHYAVATMHLSAELVYLDDRLYDVQRNM